MIKKLLLPLIMLVLLSGCSTVYKANKLYEKGQYIGSVKEITEKLDRTGKLPYESTSRKMFDLIHKSIDHYERALPDSNSKNYPDKIYAYEGIYNIRLLLENKFYSDKFSVFLNSYTTKDLKVTLAEQYYLHGNTMTPSQIGDYKTKANIYRKGLSYGEHKDMRKLMEQNDFKYADLSAADAYAKGECAAKDKSYRDASEYFASAIMYYKDYGDYKDSKQLFVKYDKLWRTEVARDAYTQAQYISRRNMKKADHRSVAKLYKSAYDIYRPYGVYENSYKLWKEHEKLGVVNIYLSIDRGIGGRFSDRQESDIKQAVKRLFDQNYYNLSEYNSSSADVKIYVYYKMDYDENRDQLPRSRTIEADGKRFTETKTIKENRVLANVEVKVSSPSFSTKTKEFKAGAYSSEVIVRYSGDVPSGYRNSSSGRYKRRVDLEEEISDEINRQLFPIIKNVREEIDRQI